MTIKSMTGYGRSEVQDSGVHLSVEILSVNRKHLDINLVLPKHLNRFDPDIRKKASESIFRGHVTIRINIAYHGSSPLVIRPNTALAKQLYEGWGELAESCGLESDVVSLSLLRGESDLFVYEETPFIERVGSLVLQGIEEAIKPFLAMREREGMHLEKDMRARLKILRSNLEKISQESSLSSEKYRKKLLDKMLAVLPELDTADERLIKEIALFAEKVDVAEELVRFSSHIDQYEKLLSCSDVNGKTLEFLLQELGREINTIGSKTQELAVTKLVIEMKTELERLREQIQNIE